MPTTRPRGVGAVEVIVALVVLLAVVLIVAMALPRQRETARLAGCQRNLMQIGMGLNLYAQVTNHWPTVADGPSGPGPLAALLEALGQPDLAALTDHQRPPPRRVEAPITARIVPEFVCPSDPLSRAVGHPAPTGYRATTGDTPDGRGGPFAPGRVVGPSDVEAGDGLAYTAAFCERLVGDGRHGAPGPRNYAVVAGAVDPHGCPDVPAPQWRGDAGASWRGADWRSTLYHHGLTPNATPSCLAADGRTAGIGASSGHAGRVHLLTLDGGVRPFTPTIDPRVWRSWGTINDRGPTLR